MKQMDRSIGEGCCRGFFFRFATVKVAVVIVLVVLSVCVCVCLLVTWCPKMAAFVLGSRGLEVKPRGEALGWNFV